MHQVLALKGELNTVANIPVLFVTVLCKRLLMRCLFEDLTHLLLL